MKNIGVYDLFKRKVINCEFEYGLNVDDEIGALVVAEGKTEASFLIEVVQ